MRQENHQQEQTPAQANDPGVDSSTRANDARDPMMQDALSRFGLTEFRPSQKEVIDSVLAGRPTLGIMPTGAGKSLCYQLPALLIPGVTVVVSPLISLMKDQVDALERVGIAAAAINSQLDDGERAERFAGLRSGKYKIVYVAPERFRSQRFMETLQTLPIGLFAVDEAHCVSAWGHDFRPDYLRLGQAIAALNPKHVLALTATATPEVRDDIALQLGMNDAAVFVRGFDRPNLFFSVESVALKEKAPRTAALVRGLPARGGSIAYAGTRKNAEALAQALTAEGLAAGVYHAGLDDEQRKRVQEDFMASKFDVLVATNAFGMGVDKRDVRLVVHVDLPRSLEAYYQEAGRAGRDGGGSQCVMLFNASDVRLQEYFIDSSYPPPDVLRNVWKALQRTPALDSELLATEAKAKNAMQAEAAVRVLQTAGYLTQSLEAVRPPADAPPFDAAAPERRAALERKKLQRMVAYAYSHACRRHSILAYFGDAASSLVQRCGHCDNCSARASRPIDARERKRVIVLLQLVDETNSRYGRQRLVQILRGEESDEVKSRGLQRLAQFGLLQGDSKESVLDLIAVCERSQLLRTEAGEYPTIAITPEGLEALADPDVVTTLAIVQPRTGKAAAKKPQPMASGPVDEQLFAALKAVRTRIASEEQIPPFMVFSNKTLEALARMKPTTHTALMRVPGIGAQKAEWLGQRLLEVVSDESRTKAS